MRDLAEDDEAVHGNEERGEQRIIEDRNEPRPSSEVRGMTEAAASCRAACKQ